MQLLKKIFKTGEGSTSVPVPPMATEEGLWSNSGSLLDIFTEDLGHIRLETFEKGKAEVQASGDIIQSYCKKLERKELGIFDTMCVRLIGNSINVVFKSSKPAEVGMDKMKRVINELYALYGRDNADKGEYSDNDEVDYSDKHFYVLFGRDWMDYPRYTYPVTIRRYSDEVFMSIWGLSTNNIIQ
jgi:hypothetical protein